MYYHTYLAAFALGVIAFIAVVASGHRNAVALSGQPLRYSMTDLFVAFLVPPFNLVWPYRIVREIWDATSPVAPATHGPRELRSWLLAWIIAVVTLGIPGIGAVLAVPVVRAIGIPPLVSLVVSSLTMAWATWCSLAVVRGLTARMLAAWAAAGNSG